MTERAIQSEPVQHQTQWVGCPAIAPAVAGNHRGNGGPASKLSVSVDERSQLARLGLDHPHERRDARDLLRMIDHRRRRLEPLSDAEGQRITAVTRRLMACQSPRLQCLGAKLAIAVKWLNLTLWQADAAASAIESKRQPVKVFYNVNLRELLS